MKEFLSTVLASQGVYCVSTIHPIHGFVRNIVCQTIDDMCITAQANMNEYDVYLACSTFNAQPFSRTQRNALYQRSLWLDIDCGQKKFDEGKGYKTRQDALYAVKDFLDSTGLPPPTVVNSGYGVHLYWPLDRDIPTAQWDELSCRLAQLCAERNLIVDTTRTEDSASIMRMPDTLNHKYGTTAPISVMKRTRQYNAVAIAQCLMRLVPQPNHTKQHKHKPEIDIPEALRKQFASIEKPCVSAEKMIEKCAQIRHCGSASYDVWMCAARTLMHCVDGHKSVHELSAADERYTYDNTEKLINSLSNYEDVGPCRCDTFIAKSGVDGHCANCPFRGKITTPLQLAELPKQEAVTLPVVPVSQGKLDGENIIDESQSTDEIQIEPFSCGNMQMQPGVGIVYLYEDEDGAKTPICIMDIEIYIHTLYMDTSERVPKRTYIMRKICKNCAPVDIPFVIEDALGPQQTEKWLAQVGMLPQPKYKKKVIEFMNTYIAHIQNRLEPVVVRDHFGWDSGKTRQGESYNGFILGSDMYTANGIKAVRLDDRADNISRKFDQRGTLEGWRPVANLYKDLDQKFAQLLMLTAFGSPFMHYGIGTAQNVAYSLWDANGGKGKSSLLRAIASVWGDPNQLLMGSTDTKAARFQLYSVYRNLPVLIDEITCMYDGDTASMLYDIVNGKEKSRSTSAGTGLAKSGHWETITVFTSNTSLYEMLKNYKAQTSATCMRVIEYTCDFENYSGTATAVTINNAMNAARDNYGVAGREFIKYVVSHPECIERIRTEAQAFALRNEQQADERFWLYGMAIPLIAGRVAHDAGIIDYDIDALTKYCEDELLPMLRKNVKADKPTGTNLFSDFLMANINNTLTVRSKTRPQSDSAVLGNFNGIDPYIVMAPSSHNVLIRREADTDTIYITASVLGDWCKQRHISKDTMLTELEKNGYMPYGKSPSQVKLAKFVPVYPQNRSRVYTIIVPAKDREDYNITEIKVENDVEFD